MRLRLCMLGLLVWLPPALAQAPVEPPNKPPLSDRLEKSDGVIAPKQNLDPEMRAPAAARRLDHAGDPATGDAPGGDPNVKPK